MKRQFSLLALGLMGIGIANAQTTTNTYSTTSTTTNPTYTSPVTTDSTNSMSNRSTNDMNSTNSNSMNNGTTNNMNSTNSMNSTTPNSTYSTNTATPTDASTTTTTTTYSTTDRPERVKAAKDYKNFVFGIYAGLNSTKLRNEPKNNSGNISGRLGYQAGFFVRGGKRLFGQLGAEYFASSSNYFTAGDGQSVASIQDQINIQYIQIPVYIGYKLLESDRGISAIRLQAGVEYANNINSSSGKFNLSKAEIQSGSLNGLGQLGFDIGPLLIDLTYHYGFSDAIKGTNATTGFSGSARRIFSASVGFKF